MCTSMQARKVAAHPWVQHAIVEGTLKVREISYMHFDNRVQSRYVSTIIFICNVWINPMCVD